MTMEMKERIIEHGQDFLVVRTKSGLGIMCKICKLISYNQNDIREKYCGNCNQWRT